MHRVSLVHCGWSVTWPCALLLRCWLAFLPWYLPLFSWLLPPPAQIIDRAESPSNQPTRSTTDRRSVCPTTRTNQPHGWESADISRSNHIPLTATRRHLKSGAAGIRTGASDSTLAVAQCILAPKIIIPIHRRNNEPSPPHPQRMLVVHDIRKVPTSLSVTNRTPSCRALIPVTVPEIECQSRAESPG